MIIDSVLRVETSELTRKEWERLLTTLTFRDADFEEVMAYDLRGSTMVLTRGILDKMPERLEITDLRSRPAAPKLTFTKDLGGKGFEGQREALVAMVAQGQGQIVAPPGKGKTEIGLAFAAQCRTTTLVVVHTKDLFKQWIDRTKVSVPGAKVGQIRASHVEIGQITIAMAQSLKNFVGAGSEFWQQFGCLIIDEAHHAAAETWEWMLNTCPAYYRFGLTATEKRADGRHPLVRFYIGPVIYKMKFEAQVPMEIQPVKTTFGRMETVYRGPFDWTRMLGILARDETRNGIIAEQVLADIANGHSVLVLSRQIAHLQGIQEAMRAAVTGADEFTLLTGKMTGRVRQTAVEGLRDGSLRCILATQLADEGLDVPRIDRVHLTFPGKHDGRIIQQIGRALRKADDKTDAVITDYVDGHVAVLLRQYDQRATTYRKLGLKIRRPIEYAEKKERRTISDLVKLARSGSVARSRRP